MTSDVLVCSVFFFSFCNDKGEQPPDFTILVSGAAGVATDVRPLRRAVFRTPLNTPTWVDRKVFFPGVGREATTVGTRPARGGPSSCCGGFYPFPPSGHRFNPRVADAALLLVRPRQRAGVTTRGTGGRHLLVHDYTLLLAEAVAHLQGRIEVLDLKKARGFSQISRQV